MEHTPHVALLLLLLRGLKDVFGKYNHDHLIGICGAASHQLAVPKSRWLLRMDFLYLFDWKIRRYSASAF